MTRGSTAVLMANAMIAVPLEGGGPAGRAVDPFAAADETLAQEHVHDLLSVEARAVPLLDHRFRDVLVVLVEVADTAAITNAGLVPIRHRRDPEDVRVDPVDRALHLEMALLLDDHPQEEGMPVLFDLKETSGAVVLWFRTQIV